MQMRVKIKKDGEHPLEMLDKTVVESYDRTDESTPIYTKTLRSVFNAIAKNPHGKAVNPQNLPKGIFPETLTAARSFIIAHMPGLYADYAEGWPLTPHVFLIDENLPRTLGSDLWKEFGRATHTDYEALSGQHDKDVWRWARLNDVSAVITRDKRMTNDGQDLGLIAVRHAYDLLKKRKKNVHPVEMPNMPLLIQLTSRTKKSPMTLLETHWDAIMEHLEKRTTPYIFLTEKECVNGPSYSDLTRHDWATIKIMARDIVLQSKGKTRKNKGNGPPPPAAP